MRTLAFTLLAACAPKAPPAPVAAQAAAAGSIPDATWQLHAREAIQAPADLPELMGGYFDAHVLVSLTGEGGPTLHLDSASADGAPMGCGLTTSAPLGALGAGGAFSIALDEVPLVGEDDVAFTLSEARIEGAVSADGLTLSSITGSIDSGAFVGLLGSEDRAALCAMAGARIPCGPCPDGGETCWDLSLTPALEPAPALTPRAAAEVCAQPSCADRPWCAGGGDGG